MKNRMVLTMLLLPSCGKLDIVFDYNQHYLYYETDHHDAIHGHGSHRMW